MSDRDTTAAGGTWPGELPEDQAVASLVAEVAAALRMARWGGIDAVPRKPRPAGAAAQPAATGPGGPRPNPATAPSGSRPVLPPRTAPSTPQPTVPASLPSLADLGALVSRRPRAQEAIDKIRAEALACDRCPRAQLRQGAVFGTGNPTARYLILLGTPSEAEDMAGRPAAGDSGKLLEKMLAAIGLGWDDIWVTHVCLCRGDLSAPTREETQTCSPWLRKQWEVVQPKALLAFGVVPAQFLLRQQRPLADLRGKWFEIRGVPALCTWSADDVQSDSQKKREAWDDLKNFVAHVGKRPG